MIVFQFPLPGVIEILPEQGPSPLTAPEWVLAHLREAVIERLPEDAPPAMLGWVRDTRAGRFDGQPLMQAALAGWHAARGKL